MNPIENSNNIENAGNIRRIDGYLSDEELERLIAATEEEPLLHAPRGLKSEIIGQIRRKRKRAKNFQLFSYSMKVFAAAAAAITIMIVVPENIRSEDSIRERVEQEESMQEAAERSQTLWERQEKEGEQIDNGNLIYRFNEKMDDYCSQLNKRLNKLVGMEDF